MGPSLPDAIEIDSELYLERLSADQAGPLYETIVENRDYLVRWLPFPKFTHSVEDTKSFIEQKSREWDEAVTYAYAVKDNSRFVGVMDIRNLKDNDKTPEIGYWISSKAAGKGIATKAVEALTELAFSTFNLSKIMIRAHKGNHGSNRVAEKAGYELVRHYEDEEGVHNVWEKARKVDEGPFYHGTKADLKVGDLLSAGFQSNYRPEITMNHIYFTVLANGAGLAAELSRGAGRSRVYAVEPTGEFEDDPNVTNKKFPGNPTRSYRSKAPLRIIGEVDDWTRLTPEELREWRERLANIKGEIVN
jgi:RimJ/RimL family protein N-acetyltransferase